MSRVFTVTEIDCPIERCFDLARDVEVHAKSCAQIGERVLTTHKNSVLSSGEVVTFQANLLGRSWQMTAKITRFDPPHQFVDEMTSGPFRRFRHKHMFTQVPGGKVRMVDEIKYRCGYGPFGWLAERLVVDRTLKRVLETRGQYLKGVAEENGNGKHSAVLKPVTVS